MISFHLAVTAITLWMPEYIKIMRTKLDFQFLTKLPHLHQDFLNLSPISRHLCTADAISRHLCTADAISCHLGCDDVITMPMLAL